MIQSSYVPQDLEYIRVGTEHKAVAKKFSPNAPEDEKYLKAIVTINAISSARTVSSKERIQLVAERLGLLSTTDVEIRAVESDGFDSLKDPANLEVLGYHNHLGGEIPQAVWKNDTTGFIKDVQDGAADACRPEDVTFARVRGKVKLQQRYAGVETSYVVFCIRLPKSDQTYNDAGGQQRTRNTYVGPSDIMGQTTEAYRQSIYYHGEAVQDPFMVDVPSFIDPGNATLKIDVVVNAITELIFKTAAPHIYDYLKQTVAPSYTNDPAKTLRSIRQETVSSDGTKKSSSVAEYNSHIQAAIGLLDSSPSATWTMNPFIIIIDGYSPEIRAKMEDSGFKKHQEIVSLKPVDQIRLIAEAANKATIAERALRKEVERTTKIVTNIHGLHTSTTAEGHPEDWADGSSSALMSAADRTIGRHEAGKFKCWACESTDHVYYDKQKNKVMCPKGHIAEFKARADKRKAEWLAKRQAQRERKKAKIAAMKKENETAKSFTSILELDIDASTKKNLINKLLEKEKSHTSSGGTHTFLTIYQVMTSNNKPQLPIPVKSALPHLKLLVGQADAKFQPGFYVIADAAAALSVGSSKFIMPIIKAYPELVKSITLAKDQYSPITLTGVVNSENGAQPTNLTCNLPAVIELCLPYSTRDGLPTSLKIAVGPHVAVNVTLGMSFMHAAKMVIDLNDDVIESKFLECSPFPITCKLPIVSEPNILPREEPTENPMLLTQRQIVDEASEFVNAYEVSATGEPSDFKATSDSQSPVTFDFETSYQELLDKAEKQCNKRKKVQIAEDVEEKKEGKKEDD